MKVLLASSERFSGCLIASLEKAGHEVIGVVSPAKGIYQRQFRDLRFMYYDLRGWDILDTCRVRDIEFRVSRFLEEGAITAFIKHRRPDLLLLFGWPTMVTPQTLALFPRGGMNIHPSLLPQLRGPDPIYTIVDEGRTDLGLSFHRVVDELDAGPLYLQVPLAKGKRDSYDDLYFRVLNGIVDHLGTAIQQLTENPEGTPQEGEPSMVTRFDVRDMVLDPSWPLDRMARRVRACFSHHPCLTACGGQLISFARMKVLRDKPLHRAPRAIQRRGPFSVVVHLQGRNVRLSGVHLPGKPWWLTPPWLYTICRPGSLLATAAEVADLQAANKRKRFKR